VTIGNGAVNSASVVVTHDVSPNGVVVRIPSRWLKFQFDELTVARLSSIRPCDWAEDVTEQAPAALLDDQIGQVSDRARSNCRSEYQSA
jgi:hypothetical protein